MTTKAPSKSGLGFQDYFEFTIIEKFVGYVTSVDKTMVSPHALIRGSRNVYQKLSGTIAIRPGLKRRGTADTTAAAVTSSFEWATALAQSYPLRYVKDTGKLQFESNIADGSAYVWYDILTGLTATAIAFETWWDNTAKKDILLFVLGDSSMRAWSGAVAKVLSTTVGTIVLDRTVASAGFSNTSTVKVNGNSYVVTSASGSTLNVSSDPTGEAVGSVVFEAVVVTATTPASGFLSTMIRVTGNQVAVGSSSSRLVYMSKNTSYTDYSQSTPRLTGEGNVLTLDDIPTAIAVRNGDFHISAGLSDWYVVTLTQLTTGTVLSEQVNVAKQHTSDLGAAKGHEFVDSIGDSLVYLDQQNQLRLFGEVRNINTPQFPTLSLPIQDEIKDVDFTGGHLRCVADFVYITAPTTGITYLYQVRQNVDALGNITSERLWHSPFVWNVSRIAVISGVVYGHSNANPQVYQLWDTLQWHDDSPTDDPLPYDAVARFGYNQNGRRQGLTSFDKLYSEGYMTQGTILYGRIYLDYQGATNLLNPIINTVGNPAQFYVNDSAPSLGGASLGDNPLGDGISPDPSDQERLPKFRSINDVAPGDSFEQGIEYYSQDIDSRWEILCYGTNPQVSANRPVQLRH